MTDNWLTKTYAEELSRLRYENELAKDKRKKEWHRARELTQLRRRVRELEAEVKELKEKT